MFFAFIICAGVVAVAGGLLILLALAWLECGPAQRIGLDDATTLLHVLGALGAAVFALWAPRSRFGWLSRTTVMHRKAGRVLASLLVLYAVYWGGYFVERQLDESVHRASPRTFLVAVSAGLALYLFDIRRSRVLG